MWITSKTVEISAVNATFIQLKTKLIIVINNV